MFVSHFWNVAQSTYFAFNLLLGLRKNEMDGHVLMKICVFNLRADDLIFSAFSSELIFLC